MPAVFFFYPLLPGKKGFLFGSLFFFTADCLAFLLILFQISRQDGPGMFLMAGVGDKLMGFTLAAFKIDLFRKCRVVLNGLAEGQLVKLRFGEQQQLGFIGLCAKEMAGGAVPVFV
jgi:hypothetical protein